MNGIKNSIMGCIMLPLIIFLNSTETRFPKTFEKPRYIKNAVCFEKVGNKIALHRLSDKCLLPAETERNDFERDYFFILH